MQTFRIAGDDFLQSDWSNQQCQKKKQMKENKFNRIGKTLNLSG